MPNNGYLRSRKRERELVNQARSHGLQSGRTAGSKSPWDLYVWNEENKEVLLIQVKTKKGSRNLVKKNVKTFYPVTVMTATYSYE